MSNQVFPHNPGLVLVCDDNPDILQILIFIIEEAGFKALPITSSKDVVDAAHHHKPVGILLDLWMPHLTGDEITRRLKEDEATAKVPVILLSASREGRHAAKEAGANVFIEKPFNVNHLIGELQKHFSCCPAE
jgi:CheY-like chemotaxis protein